MTVTTGPPVHGGYALARPEGMGVLFVRWALPGEVVAVEGEARSFKELRGNVRENGLGNVRIVRSSVEAFRPEGRFDALVLDPPRAGLSERSLARVREVAAGKVLYVSCNPATLARDVRSLSDRYDLASLEMHDFFPNTHHVEALAVLTAR